jgi:hypothetical protein
VARLGWGGPPESGFTGNVVCVCRVTVSGEICCRSRLVFARGLRPLAWCGEPVRGPVSTTVLCWSVGGRSTPDVSPAFGGQGLVSDVRCPSPRLLGWMDVFVCLLLVFLFSQLQLREYVRDILLARRQGFLLESPSPAPDNPSQRATGRPRPADTYPRSAWLLMMTLRSGMRSLSPQYRFRCPVSRELAHA